MPVLLILESIDKKPDKCLDCPILGKNVNCPLIKNAEGIESFEAQYLLCPLVDIVKTGEE